MENRGNKSGFWNSGGANLLFSSSINVVSTRRKYCVFYFPTYFLFSLFFKWKTAVPRHYFQPRTYLFCIFHTIAPNNIETSNLCYLFSAELSLPGGQHTSSV